MGSMILNTHVAGDAASVRESATWLGTLAKSSHEAASSANNARVASASVWSGTAGNAFRDAVAPLATDGDHLVDNTNRFQRALEAFADAVAAVRAKMDDARGKAAAGGLKMTPKEIYPPAPVPPGPPIGGASSPQSPADAQRMAAEHNAAMDAYHNAINTYNAQAKVFNECKSLVEDARNIEKGAHAALDQAATGVSEWVKDTKSIATRVASTAAGTIKGMQGSVNDLNRLAVELSDSADIFDKIANGKYLTDADKAILTGWSADSKTKAASAVTRATSVERWISKIPEGTRKFIEWNPGTYVQDAAGIMKPTKVILKGLPLVGTGITVASTVGDVLMGEDPGKAAAKAGAGLAGGLAGGWAGGALAGAVSGSAVPGIGTVVGGLVGGIVGSVAATEIVESSMGE